ncbi:MAG: hypothetical protein WKF94_10180 [Solirubrobacteraceae bacterium]
MLESSPTRWRRRTLLTVVSLALAGTGALLLWAMVAWSAACLQEAGDTSPYCESRLSVPVAIVLGFPLVALCAAAARVTARAARADRPLTRSQRRFVTRTVAGLSVLALVTVPYAIVFAPLVALLALGARYARSL